MTFASAGTKYGWSPVPEIGRYVWKAGSGWPSGVTDLHRRAFTLSIPAGYTLNGARLKFFSDNRSRWYLNGVLVADLNSSYANTVAVSTASLVSGANLLAVAVSNDNFAPNGNPMGLQYVLNLPDTKYRDTHARRDCDQYRDINGDSNTYGNFNIDRNAISHTDANLYRDGNTDAYADPDVDCHAHTDTDVDFNPDAHANTHLDAGADFRAVERAIPALGVVCAVNWLARADGTYDSNWIVATLCAHFLRDGTRWYCARSSTHREHKNHSVMDQANPAMCTLVSAKWVRGKLR